MESFFGIKIGVILAAVAGAAFRVFRVQSHAKTWYGVLFDKATIFTLSIAAALILLGPIMTWWSIPDAYEAATVAGLALVSHDVIAGALSALRDCDIPRMLTVYGKYQLRKFVGRK